jgi:hypothetical protein
MEGVEIRNLSKEEIPLVSRLASKVGHKHYSAMCSVAEADKWLEEYGATDLMEERFASSHLLLGAYFENDLVGMAHLTQGSVGAYCLVPSKGIGSKLLTRLMTHAEEEGIEELRAEIHSFNIPSQKLFGRYGFTRSWGQPSSMFIDQTIDSYVCLLD